MKRWILIRILPLGIFVLILAIAVPLIFNSDWNIAIKWSAMGSLAAVLGLGVAISVGSMALLQFLRSQRKPDLRLVFNDTKKDSTIISIPASGGRHQELKFALLNDGNSVAVWYEVIIDLSSLLSGGPRLLLAVWDTMDHLSLEGKKLLFQSFGRRAAFTSARLEIGGINFSSNVEREWQPEHKIPYVINGDWGAPQEGTLVLKTTIESDGGS